MSDAIKVRPVVPHEDYVRMDGNKLIRIEVRGSEVIFPEDLPFKDWLHYVSGLLLRLDLDLWRIGASLNFALKCIATDCREHRNGTGDCQRRYGERYKALLEAFRLRFHASYLLNIAWVQRSATSSRYRELLSFGHHQEVAPLGAKEQERWLALAAKNEWTQSRLRGAIRDESANESERAETPESFVPSRWARQGLAFYEGLDLERMPEARRVALRKELQPVLERLTTVYDRLSISSSTAGNTTLPHVYHGPPP